MKHKTAAILIIGNEILSGRTRDCNAWLAVQKLFECGCRVQEVATIADDRDAIISTLRRLQQQYDGIITSGGIGPTHDDITMDCVAETLHVPLQQQDSVMELMAKRYGQEQLNEGRRRMAAIPAGATMIVCPESIAPGAHAENIYVLAGVPNIFASQLETILPDFGGQAFFREEVTFDVAESIFSTALGELQQKFPDVELGSYPQQCGAKPTGIICLTSQDQQQLNRACIAIKAMFVAINATRRAI